MSKDLKDSDIESIYEEPWLNQTPIDFERMWSQKKKMKKGFDQEQLKAGTKVEMEHTDKESVARKIAQDHLNEDPDYYRDWKDKEKILFQKEAPDMKKALDDLIKGRGKDLKPRKRKGSGGGNPSLHPVPSSAHMKTLSKKEHDEKYRRHSDIADDYHRSGLDREDNREHEKRHRDIASSHMAHADKMHAKDRAAERKARRHAFNVEAGLRARSNKSLGDLCDLIKGRGKDLKPRKHKGLSSHPNYNKEDHAHLSGKGYKDHEIKRIWDKDKSRGHGPTGGKPNIPNVVGGVSNFLKKRNTMKKSLDDLCDLIKGGPGSGKKGHKTAKQKLKKRLLAHYRKHYASDDEGAEDMVNDGKIHDHGETITHTTEEHGGDVRGHYLKTGKHGLKAVGVEYGTYDSKGKRTWKPEYEGDDESGRHSMSDHPKNKKKKGKKSMKDTKKGMVIGSPDSLIRESVPDFVIKSTDESTGRMGAYGNTRDAIENGLAKGHYGSTVEARERYVQMPMRVESKPDEEGLKNTHGENWHADNDKQVQEFVESVSEIDVHERGEHPKSVRLRDARNRKAAQRQMEDTGMKSTLDEIVDLGKKPLTDSEIFLKSFPMPPKPGGKAKKQPKDPEEKKVEAKQQEDSGVMRSLDALIDLSKGQSGMCGNTRSGKPIYTAGSKILHNNYEGDDYKDAAERHMNLSRVAKKYGMHGGDHHMKQSEKMWKKYGTSKVAPPEPKEVKRPEAKAIPAKKKKVVVKKSLEKGGPGSGKKGREGTARRMMGMAKKRRQAKEGEKVMRQWMGRKEKKSYKSLDGLVDLVKGGPGSGKKGRRPPVNPKHNLNLVEQKRMQSKTPPATTKWQNSNLAEQSKKKSFDVFDDLVKGIGESAKATHKKKGKSPNKAASANKIMEPKNFMRSRGPGGAVFDFGPATGNPIADHTTKMLNQNADPEQFRVAKGQQESFRKALDTSVSKGTVEAAPGQVDPEWDKMLNTPIDDQVKKAHEEGALDVNPMQSTSHGGGPDFSKSKHQSTQMNLGGDTIKATSETDAALIEMMKKSIPQSPQEEGVTADISGSGVSIDMASGKAFGADGKELEIADPTQDPTISL